VCIHIICDCVSLCMSVSVYVCACLCVYDFDCVFMLCMITQLHQCMPLSLTKLNQQQNTFKQSVK